MAMNPDTNKLEHCAADFGLGGDLTSVVLPTQLVRPDGSTIPDHWSTFTEGEEVTVKNYRWVVAHIGEQHLLLEPLGPVLVGESEGGR